MDMAEKKKRPDGRGERPSDPGQFAACLVQETPANSPPEPKNEDKA